MFAHEVPRQSFASGRAFMKHPERVEDYLEHMSLAIERGYWIR
jgi:hypothetical protein